MKKTKEILELFEKKTEVSIDKVKIGDKVYLSSDDRVEYEILDIGSPFSLILNTETNFAYLYKGMTFYIQ